MLKVHRQSFLSILNAGQVITGQVISYYILQVLLKLT